MKVNPKPQSALPWKASTALGHKFGIIRHMSNADEMMKLPFSVDRKLPHPLVEQVVMGVKQAIDFGKYKVGDIIPATRELAEMLGVSRIVTRQAVRRLADNGYLAPRPGVGCVVLGRGVKLWKGSVLLVMHRSKGVYYTNAFADELTLLLAKEGWRLLRVLTKRDDLSLLDLEISHGADFALVMFENELAVKRLRRGGIPFASIGLPVRGCAFQVRYRREAALETAVEELRVAGVKTAWQVGFESHPEEFSVLALAGFDSREVIVGKPTPSGSGSSTARSFAMFSGLLTGGGCRLPDFIYFTDDGICQGALLAFLKHGVRIPEDVKVMSWSNNGRGPYGYDAIVRAQISTSENAATVAKNLLGYLKEDKFERVVELATELVRA